MPTGAMGRRLHVCFDAVSTSLFPMALGLAGTGAAWRAAAAPLDVPRFGDVGEVLGVVAAGMLVAVAAAYGGKALAAPDEVAMDLASVNTANLLAPALMTGAVVGAQFADHSAGKAVWAVSACLHGLLLLAFVGRWLTASIEPEELTPTWFLPTAGFMTSALTWPQVGSDLLPWMIVGVGATTWLMLLPLVFRRLLFEPPLAPALRPTLMIMAAPFGLAAGSALELDGQHSDWVALPLVSAGSFLVLVFATDWRFLTSAGVTLTWWAATFPQAVLAAVWFRLAGRLSPDLRWLGILFLVSATLAVLMATATTGAVLSRAFRGPPSPSHQREH
ncbi:MAG: hypothetical protein R2695_11340 [Acidimicrobiales bacterium]